MYIAVIHYDQDYLTYCSQSGCKKEGGCMDKWLWLRVWAVNHNTMGSNPAETVNIFSFLLFLLLYLLTPHMLNTGTVPFPNVLL